MLVNGAWFLLEPGRARVCFVIKDSTERLHLLFKFELSGKPECFVLVRIDIRETQVYVYKLTLWVRAYPWILSKYLCVCVFVSFVPLQIILGTDFRLRICILVVESLWYLVEILNIMQPHVFPMYVTFLHTFDTDSYINCWCFLSCTGVLCM